MKKNKIFKLKLIQKYIQRFFYFFIQSLYRNNINKKKVKRISFIRLKHLGDFLLAIPAIDIVRQVFPEAEITMVTGIWNKGLTDFFNYNFDNIIFYNLNENCRNITQKMTLFKKLGILKAVFRRKQDICFDFDGSIGFLLMYLLRRTRYLSSIESMRMRQNLEQMNILKNKYNYNIHSNYEKDNLNEIVKAIGIENKVSKIKLKFSNKVNKRVLGFLSDNMITSAEKIIGIHPSAGKREKLWDNTKFAELCNILAENNYKQILLFGSKEDKNSISAIRKRTVNKPVDCSGFTIEEFICAVKQCDIFICLDSFAQHVAYINRVPAAVIYNIKNEKRWTPADSGKRFITVFNYDNNITAENVFKKLERLLTEKEKR